MVLHVQLLLQGSFIAGICCVPLWKVLTSPISTLPSVI